MSYSRFDPTRNKISNEISVEPSSTGDMLPIGETSPSILVQQAAEGRRGAAWRLIHLIMENDPQAINAVTTYPDDSLALHLLEFIAIGTWADKPIDMPVFLHAAHTRTRLRTLFLPGAGIEQDQARRVVRKAMQNQQPSIRETAAYLLGLMNDHGAIPLLVNALKDPAVSVRLEAAKALGRIGDPIVVPDLLHSLNSAEEFLGSQIFQALVQMGPKAVPALIEECNHSSSWIRWYCMRALGKIGDDRAVAALVRGLLDKDHSVAWMAAKSLSNFGTLSVEPVLRTLALGEMTPWLMETSGFILKEQSMRYGRLTPFLMPVVHEMHKMNANITIHRVAYRALEQLLNQRILVSGQLS